MRQQNSSRPAANAKCATAEVRSTTASSANPRGEVVKAKIGARVRYSISQLLSLRQSAVPSPCLEFCPNPRSQEQEYHPALNKGILVKEEVADVKNGMVLSFRINPTRHYHIKFQKDMDVPASQIVHAYNLSKDVEWYALKTFCLRTVGVPARDFRMIRRHRPEAMIIFNSSQEAQNFLNNLPPNLGFKKCHPTFALESELPSSDELRRMAAHSLQMMKKKRDRVNDGHSFETMEVEAAELVDEEIQKKSLHKPPKSVDDTKKSLHKPHKSVDDADKKTSTEHSKSSSLRSCAEVRTNFDLYCGHSISELPRINIACTPERVGVCL